MSLFGFPYAEVVFTADGSLDGAQGGDAVQALAADPAVTDLMLLVHGWNNDLPAARLLFGGITASVRAVVDGGHGLPPGRGLGIAGVVWPSREFALPWQMGGAAAVSTDGAAAAVGSPVSVSDLLAAIDRLRPAFPTTTSPDAAERLDAAAALVPRLTDEATARRAFADAVRGLVTVDRHDLAEGPTALFELPGDTVLQRLAMPVTLPRPAAPGMPAPGMPAPGMPAPGMPALFGGPLGAGLALLNFTTFYAMKERSAVVGAAGLAPLLAKLSVARPAGTPPLRLHLVGHSFGARLVAAATKALPAGTTVASLALLQGAFSHFGFSGDWDAGAPGTQQGLFRADVVEQKVSGPVLITHTANDLAVGIAYAAASRLANQVAAGLGGPDDLYGGLGRNGAQRTDEAVAGTLLGVGAPYPWQPHRLHNLRADAFIHSHVDVTGREVAHALLSAATASRE